MTLQDLLGALVARNVARALEGEPAAAYVRTLQNAIEDARPSGILAVIWVNQRRGGTPAGNVHLITIARFRSNYSVIERMSRSLNRVVLELDILPVIVPLHPSTLDAMGRDTPFVRRLRRYGTLIYTTIGR